AALSRKSLPRMTAVTVSPRTKWLAIGGGALAALALGILIAFGLTRSDKPQSVTKGGETPRTTPTTPIPPDRPTDLPVPPLTATLGEVPAPSADRLYVARGPKAADRTDVFATLAAAVAKA